MSSEQTRERLLTAASRVFSLKGYEGATVADIAREAALSSGAIYSQFESKAHLLVEAVRAHRTQVRRTLFPPGRRRNVIEDLAVLAQRLNRPAEPETNLLAEALLASRRDAELAAVLAAALTDSESGVADLVRGGQDTSQVDQGVTADSIARLALMLGLGGLIVRDLDLPPIAPAEWSDLTARLLSAITPKETS